MDYITKCFEWTNLVIWPSSSSIVEIGNKMSLQKRGQSEIGDVSSHLPILKELVPTSTTSHSVYSDLESPFLDEFSNPNTKQLFWDHKIKIKLRQPINWLKAVIQGKQGLGLSAWAQGIQWSHSLAVVSQTTDRTVRVPWTGDYLSAEGCLLFPS